MTPGCPKCGSALPAEATEGLCPRCLLAEVMAPSSDLPLPEDLNELLPAGAYCVEGLLAKGGMGAVYRAVQTRLHRPVAIKILRRDQGRDFGFEQRFQREALAMAKLNHPNIVGVIDYGEAGSEYLYIVMELVDGADLMEVIRTGRMTQEMALALLPQICDALQYAHDQGIVHRDIKPSNIMLTRDGRVKVADFGLAKRHDVESSFHTQSGTGMGTPAYAAPEQLVAEEGVDHRADIYALGVMIYQMITGDLPRGAWKPPSQKSGCDPSWDNIVSQAMQSDPQDRYQQASEVKTDVSRIGSSGHAAVDSDSGSSLKPDLADPAPAPAKPSVPIVGIFLVCLVVAVGAYFALDYFGILGRSEAPSQVDAAPDTHVFVGHRYQFVPASMRWDEARTKAEAMGGHLATVTSQEENEWIYATFGENLDLDSHASSVWIGAFADSAGQPWKWVTGEPFAFSDWYENEPDYSTTTGLPVSGPFGIAIKNRDSLHWFDDPVKRKNTNVGFIVEWDDDGVATPLAPPLQEAVDLLALADVVKDAEGGIWHREGTDLIVAEDPDADRKNPKHTGVRFGFAFPVEVRGSYRIEVEFTKHGPKGTVSLILPLPEGRSVVAHFQESQPYAGLVSVRGYNTREPENPTRTPHELEDGRRYEAAAEVILKGDQVDIAVTFEGKPLFRFQGPLADLDSRQLALAYPERPGMKSIDPVTWHRFRIGTLNGGALTPARSGVILPAAGGAKADSVE